MNKMFIIAIGGTGMRCLESFVHLCAMGMFDNKTIDILHLRYRPEQWKQGPGQKHFIDLYNKIKSDDANQVNGGYPNAKTFFSAKINLYRFYTVYGEGTERPIRSWGEQRTPQRRKHRFDRPLLL